MSNLPVNLNPSKSRGLDSLLLLAAFVLLAALYIFQRFNFLGFIVQLLNINIREIHPYAFFVFNRTFRLVLNDVACMMMIYVFFRERKYLVVAFYLFLIELIIILPLYFVIKLSLEGDSEVSSPLLSQIHRIIVNPLLMILLMVAFLYQRIRSN